MSGSQEKMRAAYKAWKAAREKYEETLQRFFSGDEAAKLELPDLREEFDRTYKDFTRESAPFVHWR